MIMYLLGFMSCFVVFLGLGVIQAARRSRNNHTHMAIGENTKQHVQENVVTVTKKG